MAGYFIVDTENVSAKALVSVFDSKKPGWSNVAQAFMMNGLLMLEFNGAADAAMGERIQEAVWAVNGGAYCDVRELSGDQFDAYC